MTAKYDARIRRAKKLQEIYPFAAEILTFYESVSTVQQRISTALQKSLRPGSGLLVAGNLRERVDVDRVTPLMKEALTEVSERCPAALLAFAKEYMEGSQERWAESLQRYVDHGGTDDAAEDSREALLARVMIEPYAELLSAQHAAEAGVTAGNLCPHCEARPVAGVLRVEGDGGKRFLLCSFCSTEWEFRRIFCAYCGETREQSLPVFVAEKFPHVRVETCDTCRHCIRTVDLTKDGNAIPVVDDLAAIPLGLWAEEFGYQRIHGNLLGT
ncbi:MAG TPA: formate dehydrogenase accessory protein FdhE [Candidatus Acidoferrum sp.]|jgi:formate dehydrogenase accessory protein FdhE